MDKKELLEYLDEHIPDDAKIYADCKIRKDEQYVIGMKDTMPRAIEGKTHTEIIVFFNGMLNLPKEESVWEHG